MRLILTIQKGMRPNYQTAMGTALLTKSESVPYANVFYGQVETAASQLGLLAPRVMGAVVAHELGHLLLGTNSHGTHGIMAPLWSSKQLQRAEYGMLRFTRDQTERMQSQIKSRQRDPACASSRPPGEVE